MADRPPLDRFATGLHGDSYRPDHPKAIDQRPYLEYLERVERGEPTGRARMQLLHPDPPCHTGGGGPLSGCVTCSAPTSLGGGPG